MASDQLRKKWGTIFMGEREATPQQLDAMQEPLLRERAQHQQQEDYLARVRARAEERAREILGAAYAERQKVLEEAGAEAQARIGQLTREARAMNAQAQAELAEAEAQHGKARELREEAESIRSNAHHEGFQAGMEQAGAELKEFRVDVGQMLANMLRALEEQRHSLGEAWRQELAELARVAVEAGTGWILQAEHQRILQSLVFGSLQLLEDRATVTIRVHPDDEDTVSDLFRAARERVPELTQWIVNGDASVEAGGLVAESVSGSVENLREHYREMVNGILEHLTLPPRPEEERAAEEVSAAAQSESARLEQIVPEAAPVAQPLPEPAALLPEPSPEIQAEPAADSADSLPDQAAFADHDGTHMPDQALPPANMPAADSADLSGLADAQPDAQMPFADAAGQGMPEDMPDGLPEGLPDHAQDAAHGPYAPQMDADLSQFAPAVLPDEAVEAHDSPEGDAQPAAHASDTGAGHVANAGAGRSANPSLAELEDELFPLPEEEHDPQSSSSVFVSGGFLPGSGNGQPG